MSLIVLDSFDGYTSAEIPNYWTDDKIVSASVITTNPVHYGTQAVQPSAFGIQKTISAQTSFVIGFALWPSNLNVNVMNFKSVSTATVTTTVLQFSLKGDGVFLINRQIGGALNLASSSPKFALNANKRYYYIEWTSGVGATTLNEIRVDGNLAYSGTLNTIGTNTTISNVNRFELVGGNGNFFDDLYFCSRDGLGVNSPIGEIGVACLFPTADGSFSQWTPNSGTVHFNRVNEKPSDSDTTYNSASASAIDTYKVSTAVVNNTDVVPATEVIQLCRDDGTSGTLVLRPFIVVNGGTFGTSADNFTPLGSYIPNTKIFEQDPVNSTAWTGTHINQTEWGIQT